MTRQELENTLSLEVERLKTFSDEDFLGEIFRSWGADQDGKGTSPLFNYVTPSGSYFQKRLDGKECGCLTQIRNDIDCIAWTDELTREIHNDLRIPKSPKLVTKENLKVLKEWQLRIAERLGTISPESIYAPNPTFGIEVAV